MMITDDLTTKDGLAKALDQAGSWAALSRMSLISASTLKSRGKRLGVSLPVNDEFSDEEEDDEDPILSQSDLEAIQEWVQSNVKYLLHEAPAHIKAATPTGATSEMAEAIICAKMSQRLTELIYETHGVPLRMLWSLGWPDGRIHNGAAGK